MIQIKPWREALTRNCLVEHAAQCDSVERSLYYQKTRLPLKNCGSRGFPIVVVQHSAEFFSALDVTHVGQRRRRLDQFVLDPLMIAPLAIIVDEGRDGGPQLLLA